jgi:amidophosphoribosyltransferase
VCGIAAYATGRGVEARRAVSEVISLLIELQHRGQEATGLVVLGLDGSLRQVYTRGLAIEVYDTGTVGGVEGGAFGCLGHVRYSTTGGYWDSSVQPVTVGEGKLRLSIAFNGTIANYRDLLQLVNGVDPRLLKRDAESDTLALALALHSITRELGGDVVEGVRELSRYVVGAYSLVVLTPEPRLVLARDPRGFRPLAYAYLGEELYAASETAALEVLGLGSWREVEPGTVVSFDGRSLEVLRSPVVAEPAPCIFEYVYFSRPDSYFNGVSVYLARYRMGEALARVAPAEADVVVPVPDSARVAALGYSTASGIPLADGLVINKYVGRVFISPPGVRGQLSKLKYGVVREAVSGRRVVLVDDSIVRGTTMRSLISRLRGGGALAVHVRVSSPPFRCPCFMGIDVASRGELIAWRAAGTQTICREVGADTLAYNTLEGLTSAVGLPRVCHACFSCRYPFPGLDVENLESMFGGR